MAEITLPRALKIKNRLTGRLAKAQADIQAYNSVPQGQADQVNVLALMQTCEEPGTVVFKIAWATKSFITYQFPLMSKFQKRILSIVWPATFDLCGLPQHGWISSVIRRKPVEKAELDKRLA
jgi:hypothetical protein